MTEDKKHPAYGLISWSRLQGRHPLWRSVVDTGHMVMVAITEGYECREGMGGDEHLMNGPHIIEVLMSESQFAQFITSPNTGVGTACTIRDRVTLGGKHEVMPRIPTETKAGKLLKEEGERAAERQKTYAAEAVKEIRSIVGDKLGKKATDELNRALDRIGATTTANIEYAAHCLQEHAEKLTQKIQHEVEAVINARIYQLGEEAAKAIGLSIKEAVPALPRL